MSPVTEVMTGEASPTVNVLLVDNGSLRPEAYLNLRAVARRLGELGGREVVPASLLHSSKIDPVLLGGEPALTWERVVKARLSEGQREFLVVPFFFGPSGAIVDYMPERLARLGERYGHFRHQVAPFLAQGDAEGDRLLVEMLADRVTTTLNRHALHRPQVILVDHGSPKAAVTAVRDRLAAKLSLRLAGVVSGAVVAASMESREGPEFAFNLPLLETALAQAEGDVVVAHLFLSPGRHAGPGGDIAEICARAEAEGSNLRVFRTELLGDHPLMLELLKLRLQQGLAALDTDGHLSGDGGASGSDHAATGGGADR